MISYQNVTCAWQGRYFTADASQSGTYATVLVAGQFHFSFWGARDHIKTVLERDGSLDLDQFDLVAIPPLNETSFPEWD